MPCDRLAAAVTLIRISGREWTDKLNATSDVCAESSEYVKVY